jgi:hypothetical protein
VGAVSTPTDVAPLASSAPAAADPAASTTYKLSRPPDLKAATQLLLGLLIPGAWLVASMLKERSLTIDDAYISFRYARNLANGLGLVYNAGDRIEGFTNLLWTLMSAAAIGVGADPVAVSKIIGGAAALGTLVVTYRLSQRLKPLDGWPCLATWFLASSVLFSAYAVVGLETSFFVFLIVLGLERMTDELERPQAFPWSSIPFALAALTRPEAPMFVGIPMLCLGRRFLARQNLVRGALFAATLAGLVLWRHAYYGTWVPNSFNAKTGILSKQLKMGLDYVLGYFVGAGVLLWAAVYGLGLVIWKDRGTDASEVARWLGRASAGIALSTLLYPLAVGADWMPLHRYLAPMEPFLFLLVDLGIRTLIQLGNRAGWVALIVLGISTAADRARTFVADQQDLVSFEARWHTQAGQTAAWFVDHDKPGIIALGDIGWVGYLTNYPILDLLGLVDPVIARLPGGYGTKVGAPFQDYFFSRMPEYFVLHSKQNDCTHPWNPSTREIYEDPKDRFKSNYVLLHQIHLWDDASWCIYGRIDLNESAPSR